jgi:TRAP-type C4-dicarboxylate transport system substrate-binding protein
MRQITTIPRPIARPEGLDDIKIRVPAGQMIFDTFQAFGAQPVTIAANGIYDGLKSGKVDAQENPLAILEGFKLYELIKYVSMTNHMWSGFNQMAHLPTWRSLPPDIQGIIDRNVTRSVRAQREEQAKLNASLRADFVTRGLKFNDVDQAVFRARLPRVYAVWREKLGTKCWALLEAEVGKLG